MEIEKPKPVIGKEPSPLREGELVRVNVLRKTDGDVFLVDVRGRLLSARIGGGISSPLFIARVVGTSPIVELKYMRALGKGESPFRREKLEESLLKKRAAVRGLQAPRGFSLDATGGKADEIKGALKRVLETMSPSNAVRMVRPELSEFFVLLGLLNILDAETLLVQFPLQLGRRKTFCDLRMLGGKESANASFYLSLLLEDDRRIGFLVFIDHEILECTVSASDEALESRLRENSEALLRNLKSVARSRSVSVRFVSCEEHRLFASGAVKRVDVRM